MFVIETKNYNLKSLIILLFKLLFKTILKKSNFSQHFLITYFYDLILLFFSISVLFKNIFDKDKILQRRLRLN